MPTVFLGRLHGRCLRRLFGTAGALGPGRGWLAFDHGFLANHGQEPEEGIFPPSWPETPGGWAYEEKTRSPLSTERVRHVAGAPRLVAKHEGGSCPPPSVS